MSLGPGRVELVVICDGRTVGSRGCRSIVGDGIGTITDWNCRDTGDAGGRRLGRIELGHGLGGRRRGRNQGDEAKNGQQVPHVPGDGHCEHDNDVGYEMKVWKNIRKLSSR